MKDETKSSILKEALIEYDTILELAESIAKKKIDEQVSLKLKEVLNEKLEKNESKNNTNDELLTLKEDNNMEKKTKETKSLVNEKAGEGKPFTEKAPQETKTKDVVDDTSVKKYGGSGNKAKKKDFVETESDTPNIEEKGSDKGVAFNEKPKKSKEIKEEFDLRDVDSQSVGTAIESLDDDELITIEEIEKEIDNLNSEIESSENVDKKEDEGLKDSVVYNEIVEINSKLDEIMKNIKKEDSSKTDEISKSDSDTFSDNFELTDEEIDKILNSVEEEEEEEEEKEELVTASTEEPPVEEHLGISHSSNKKVTASIPQKDYKPESHRQHMRYGLQEMEVKMNSLLEENKKLTKKLNEFRKYKESVSTLVEGYKTALERYRDQLKEMAVFNTNLAFVNNLLLNEELALTQDDKVRIINEFKVIDSISESEKKYKAFLAEFKNSKNNLIESVKTKVSASITPSSKQKLDEVIEKTAYANDEHIQKMKNLIEYVEKRGRKK